jgi:ABC-type transport system involved in cytochrome c biogenesis ATPase subunit
MIQLKGNNTNEHPGNILGTVTKPTKGKVVWNGTNIAQAPDKVRDVIGYLRHNFAVMRGNSWAEKAKFRCSAYSFIKNS